MTKPKSNIQNKDLITRVDLIKYDGETGSFITETVDFHPSNYFHKKDQPKMSNLTDDQLRELRNPKQHFLRH